MHTGEGAERKSLYGAVCIESRGPCFLQIEVVHMTPRTIRC